MEGYYDRGSTHRLSRHVGLVSFLNSSARGVGASLAALIGAPFVILEEAIEHREGASVAELLAALGLSRFRHVESRELRRALAAPPRILVLGEGTLSDPGNRKLVARESHLVFLRPSAAEVELRLAKGAARNATLLTEAAAVPGSTADGLRTVMAARERDYRDAALVFDVAGSTHRIVSELLRRLEGAGAIAPA